MFSLAPEEDIEMRQRPATDIRFKPTARSPLHAYGLGKQAQTQDDSCGVWMNEMPLLGYIVVRGNAYAIKETSGINLPTAPHTFTTMEHGVAIWQSPDEWLIVCEHDMRETVIRNFEQSFSTLHAQVVDNSGGLTMVYISGKNHTTLLRHVGSYDFDSITNGQAVGTFCQKVNIVALRHDDHGMFVIFRRSFADYFWLLLTKAARPYRLGICSLKAMAGHPLLGLIQQ